MAFQTMSHPSTPTDIIVNKKARHDYTVLETLEAGLVLKGTEVKAIRQNKVQIREAYVRVENGEAWLLNAHIEEYSHGNIFNHKPVIPRKLLLHRKEIAHLYDQSAVSGNTLIPLRLYWKNSRVKVEIGVCRGKAQHDKRQDLKKQDADREMKRAMSAARRQ
jgi:SsrA-binding protein